MRSLHFDSSSDQWVPPDTWAIQTSSAWTRGRFRCKRSEVAVHDSCSLNRPGRYQHNEADRNYWLDKDPAAGTSSPAEEDICALMIPC